MDSFLHFFTDAAYIKAIIYALFGLILILSMVLTFIKIKYDEPDSKSSLKDIEDTLKKVLDQTKGGVGLAANGEGAPESLSDLGAEGEARAALSAEELEVLKKELEEKHLEIEELKNAAEAGAGKVNDEEHQAAMKKLAELEGKLQEYEIIEDDIADLSLFKDENAKLKKEIEGLKSGGGAPTATEEPATEEPATEEPPEPTPEPPAEKNEDLVAEFAAAVDSPIPPKPDADKKVEEAAKIPTEEIAEDLAASLEAEAEANDPVEGPIENEFLSALENEAESANEAEPEKEAEPENVASEPENTAEEPEVRATPEEAFGTDDVLAEFAAAVNEDINTETESLNTEIPTESNEESSESPPVEASAEGENALEGDIDTSKMLSEMDDLSSVEVDGSENALEGETDIEKMAAEAMSLENNEST